MSSQYGKTAHYNVTHRRRQNFYALPTAQWQMLSHPPFNLLANLDKVDEAIESNTKIASAIVGTAPESFGLDASSADWHNTATHSDLDKARSTIRQFYRDWSSEGAHEREACYAPVLQSLHTEFKSHCSRPDLKILVPGAGLGRLVYEICRAGYSCEGTEISVHQLMASSWILNHTTPGDYELYPFALDFSNVLKRSDQLLRVQIPDVHPGTALTLPDGGLGGQTMGMGSGDFIVEYAGDKEAEVFDAVATTFFVDTAPNVIRYIETVRNCLKEGGIWINIGPLLWHFADRGPADVDEKTAPGQKREMEGIEAPGSFELTDEELLLLVESMGFAIEKHEVRDDGKGYIQNPNSMLQNAYRCSHWIARKISTNRQ